MDLQLISAGIIQKCESYQLEREQYANFPTFFLVNSADQCIRLAHIFFITFPLQRNIDIIEIEYFFTERFLSIYKINSK